MTTCNATAPSDPIGATVDVPPGAVSSDTTITITEFSSTDPALPPTLAGSLGRVVEFSPDGLTFGQPVTLTFSYLDANNDFIEDTMLINEFRLKMRLLISGSYVEVPEPCPATIVEPCVFARDFDGNTITVKTGHFSIYDTGSLPLIPLVVQTAVMSFWGLFGILAIVSLVAFTKILGTIARRRSGG